MKAFLLVCCFLSVLLSVQSDTLPVLFWSGENYFPEKLQFLETVNNIDVEYVLDLSCGIPTRIASTLDVYVKNLNNIHPEVVTIFLEPKLRTDQLSQLSSAYHNSGGKDNLFTNLKTSFESSTSSLVLPYTLVPPEGSSQTLIQVATDIRRFSSLSSVFLVRNQGSRALDILAKEIGSITNTPSEFLSYLQHNEEIFNNNVTDLIIICFDESSSSEETNYRQSDVYLGNVQEIISKNTQGKYLTVFTADKPGPSIIQRSHSSYDYELFEQSKKALEGVSADETTYKNYWPAIFIQMLLTTILLIVIACVGICCNFMIQTPQKYEIPKKRGDLM